MLECDPLYLEHNILEIFKMLYLTLRQSKTKKWKNFLLLKYERAQDESNEPFPIFLQRFNISFYGNFVNQSYTKEIKIKPLGTLVNFIKWLPWKQ